MSTAWRARAAAVAAVVLGVVNLALGVATVVLDHVVHTPGTGGPLADALTTGPG